MTEETKSAKELIEKMTTQLKRMRETIELTINRTLCANRVDQKVYQGQCLIGPQIMKLLENRVEIMSQLEVKFLHVWDENLAKDPTTGLASIEEIREEMVFFGRILNCYDCVFSLLRWTRTMFLTEERTELLGAIEILSSLWPTQRVWEIGQRH